MQVSDIYAELSEATGTCDEAVNFRAITRAIEMLANQGLFDPLIGTVNFTVNGTYYIALPRDVKTPIRLNIDTNPSFARSRIFEFSQNTDGSNDGPEIGWQWHDRGYSCIQNQISTIYPVKVAYGVFNQQDAGLTLKVSGLDQNSHEVSEVLVGQGAGPDHPALTYSTNSYREIRSVTRQITSGDCVLLAQTGETTLARYYPDETNPQYRVIKLGKTNVSIRMLYRKNVFKITSQDDIIPLNSAMAVIQAVNAVRLMLKMKYEESAAAMAIAVGLITQEQQSRDENESISSSVEVQTATNNNINVNDVLIVADIYDMACEIFGSIGRHNVFDRITDAINILSNKSQWDCLLGTVDVYRSNNYPDPLATAPSNHFGYFALPRYVGAVLGVNVDGRAGIPRNRWFEFHLNGGGSWRMGCDGGAWDELGDVVIINQLPRDRTTRRVIPALLIATPENSLDEDLHIAIYGIERLDDGREVEVYRNGKPGWLCPCKVGQFHLPDGTPKFVRIDRVIKDDSAGFIRLRIVTQNYIPDIPEVPTQDTIIVEDDFDSLTVSLLTAGSPSFTYYGQYSYPDDGADPYVKFYSDIGLTHLVAQGFPPVPANLSASSILTLPESTIRMSGFQNRSDPLYFILTRTYIVPSNPSVLQDSIAITPPYGIAFTAGHPQPAQSLTIYGSTQFSGVQICTLYLDAAHTIAVGGGVLPNVQIVDPVIAFFTITIPDHTTASFVITRIYATGSPEVPAVNMLTGEILGYWYPDEIEPRYRLIRVGHNCCKNGVVRIRYRKRTGKVSSMYDLLNLRSRVAMENMMRSIQMMASNPQGALALESMAVQYTEEEMLANNPIQAGTLQFDPGTSPGVEWNIL